MQESTLNQVRERLKTLILSNPKVVSYEWEELAETNTEADFPLAHAFVGEGASQTGSVLLLPINIMFMDLVQKDASNKFEVSSDMLQVAKNVLGLLRLENDLFILDKDTINLTDFYSEKFDTEAVGWLLSFTLKIANPFSSCELPFTPVSPDATAILQNTITTVLGTFTIASGATQVITAPDATAVLKDTAGNTILTELIPSNVSEDLTCPDGHVHLKKENDGTIINLFPRSGQTITYEVADSVIELIDTAENLISTTSVHATEPAQITAPDANAVVQDLGGNTLASASIRSNSTTNIPTPIIPANTVRPTISGIPVVGQVLTANVGTWLYAPTSYNYQWLRNGNEIVGATSSTYTIVAADAGQRLSCRVTGVNAAGSSFNFTSEILVYASVLDIVPMADGVAVSLRLLRGAYLNSAIVRVRRSSDNAEADVFVDTNFEISLNSNINSRTSGTALSSWVGANSAFVTTWYDQSGLGRNLTQTVAANQPSLVNAGALRTLNGKASVFAGSSTQGLSIPASEGFFNYLHDGTLSSVHCVVEAQNNTRIIMNTYGSPTTQRGYLLQFSTTNRVQQAIARAATSIVCNNFTQQVATITNAQTIIQDYIDAGNATAANRSLIYINGARFQSTNTLTNAASSGNAGAPMNFPTPTSASNIHVQELLIYSTQPSQTGIRDNMDNYYGTY